MLPEDKEMVEEYDMQNGKLLGAVCGVWVQCSVLQTHLQSKLAS